MNNTGDGNHNNDDDINNINNPNDEEQQRKKGKGRKKIAMEKIQNETNLQVTFSKRRAGVFKKASELSTLCGAECAVVVFSPGNNPHSFGHPNVETVANRFLMNASNSDGNQQGNMGNNEATMYQRNHQLVAIDVEMERQKKRKRELMEIANVSIPPQDHLGYEELEEMKKYIENFKHAFEARLKSKTIETMWSANQNPSTQQHQGSGFHAPVGYGYGATNIVPIFQSSSSSSASFANPFHNFGTMQFPPMGPSGSSSNYGNIGVNPATIVPFDGTWRASGSGSRSDNIGVNPATVAPFDGIWRASGSGSRSGNIGANPATVVPFDGTWRASGSGSTSGNIGVNPATGVPFDGTWRASGSGSRSGTWNRNGMGTDEDPNDAPQGAPDHDTGFGGNYGNSF